MSDAPPTLVEPVVPGGQLRRGRRAIVAMLRLHPRLFAVAVSGATVFALFTVAASFAIRWIIDEAIVPRFEEGSVAVGTVSTGIGLVIAAGVVRACAVVVRRSFAGMTQWRVAESLTGDVVDRLVGQPAVWHQQRPDGDLVARAGVDVDASVGVLAPIPFATGTVVLLVVSTGWILWIDPVLGAVALVLFPLLLGLNIVYQRRVDRHYAAAQRELGAFSAGVHESFEGVQLIKAYGAEARETERLSDIAGRVRDARIRAVRLRATFEALLEFIPAATNVGLVVLGASRVSTGDLTVGALSAVIFLFTLLVFPLRLIGWTLSELPRSLAGWDRVREVVDDPLLADPLDAVEVAPDGVGLELDDVSYRHPGERSDALHGLGLRVARGEIVAVVGPTGSGKTTLVEVAGALLPAARGQVRLAEGGRAVVFQEAFLFAGTVRDNLCVGREATDDELWHALDMAAGADFVRLLPRGLDTVVGERGVSLSGGQRQRLALARALLGAPAVLLLDDTTSALDPTTEARVLGNLRTAAAGTTVLMVAARPSTIALADRVAHLVDGRIVAQGSHAELLATRPDYRHLVEAFEHDRHEGDQGAARHSLGGPT